MRGTPFVFEDFHRGLNTVANPYDLEPGETRDCMNVVSTSRGAIKKRTGSVAFSKAPENVEMTSLAKVKIGATDYLIVSNGAKLYSVDKEGAEKEIGSGFKAGSYWSIVQAEKGTAKTAGPVYLSNGEDTPQYWTGVAANTPVEPWVSKTVESEEKEFVATPKAKYLVYAGDRMWAAGMTSEPSTVRFTETVQSAEEAVPDPTSWPKRNFVQFDPEDGDPITSIGTVGPYIIVFKSHKCWVIHDLDTGENRKLSNSVGTVAHRSVVPTEGGTFFLTADQGVYLTNGSTVTELSYSIRPTLLAINSAVREHAAGAYQNNHYYLSYASGGVLQTKPNRTVDYDVTLKSWWLHDIAANQWVDWDIAAGGEPLLFFLPPIAKKGVAKAFVANTYTDLGSTYTGNGSLGAWWIGPWDPFAYYIFRHRVKSPMLKKRVRQIFFDGEGKIIPLVYKGFSTGGRQEPAVVANNEIATEDSLPVNFASGGGKWGENMKSGAKPIWGEEVPNTEILWGGEVEVGSARIYSPGVSRVWAVGWGNNSEDGFTVYSYMLAAQFRKS